MIVIAAILLGAALGWRRARTLGGKTSDKVQYAAVFGLMLAVLGLFVTIIIDRMM